MPDKYKILCVYDTSGKLINSKHAFRTRAPAKKGQTSGDMRQPSQFISSRVQETRVSNGGVTNAGEQDLRFALISAYQYFWIACRVAYFGFCLATTNLCDSQIFIFFKVSDSCELKIIYE
jgi:hypothetical protein